MNESITTMDGIISYLREVAEQNIPIPPSAYLDSATKLNILVEDLDNELISTRGKVANLKASLIGEGKSVAAAEVLVEASELFSTYLKLEAKRERIAEHVRLCKQRTELRHWE
jgi:hypothetical protein